MARTIKQCPVSIRTLPEGRVFLTASEVDCSNPSSWYDSGKATAGRIYVTLGAGKYYVIFDNLSNKAVTLYLE